MIKGYGWIKEARCGCEGKGREWQFTDLRSLYAQLLKDAVIAYPIENFGRFDPASRLVALSVALALYDAAIHYAENNKQDVGILGTNPDGALDPDLAYFRDYAGAGRRLGRGNLFIYTLPSSPLAESAIHFGLQGPILYMLNLEKPQDYLLAQAELMVKNKDALSMIVVAWDANRATCNFIA
jgi:3-oxoacyl-[acyl-carrier-protein] synthase II